MDGIILAGGKGTRMRPLTLNTPKPLLPVHGKPILEWALMGLRPTVDHVLIVVSYLKEQIADFMARQTLFSHYTLVEQLPEPQGTGHALQCCAPYLRSESFLVHNGDDLFGSRALARLAQTPLGLLTAPSYEPSKIGVVVKNEAGGLLKIDEKPPHERYPIPVQGNIGAYKLDKRIFDYQLPLSPRGEYELTDYLTWLAGITQVELVESDFWFPIGTPQDLEKAQSLDLPRQLMGEDA